MTPAQMSLEELFAAARKVVAKAAKNAPPPEENPRKLWVDESNWAKGRMLTLIHKESATVVGNFQELLHVKVADARRLVRVEGIVKTDGVETVTGAWYVAEAYRQPIHEAQLPAVRFVTVDVHLAEPDVGAMEIELAVFMQDAGIQRVELTEPTTFHGEDWFLELPANVNLMPVLTHQTKLAVKQMLDSLHPEAV